MNTKLILGIGVAIIAVVVAVVWFFIAGSSQQASPTQTNPPVTLPVGGSTTNPIDTTPTNETLTLPLEHGGTVTTNDFIHNGITLPDTSNKGRYLLAGNLGYCVPDSLRCQAGPAAHFNIYYYSTEGSFGIALLEEPLGQTRVAMEQFLITDLGISQADMCKLRYYVGTTADINEAYASNNLGFSFCPGATVLPQ